jgi:TPR repeat protein
MRSLALAALIVALPLAANAAEELEHVAQASNPVADDADVDRLCDTLAASPYDATRPAGIPGVDLSKLDIARAGSACRSAFARHPDDPRIAFQLGRIYLMISDDAQARSLTERAAARGHIAAQINLALLYEQGRGGLAKDDNEAARLYKLAADRGNAAAQWRLGFFCEFGRGGLPKDDSEAARLYKSAADQGYAFAQNSLGIFYQQGRGGLEMDDHKAACFYKRAADQGNATAQANLAKLYRDGRAEVLRDDCEPAPP